MRVKPIYPIIAISVAALYFIAVVCIWLPINKKINGILAVNFVASIVLLVAVINLLPICWKYVREYECMNFLIILAQTGLIISAAFCHYGSRKLKSEAAVVALIVLFSIIMTGTLLLYLVPAVGVISSTIMITVCLSIGISFRIWHPHLYLTFIGYAFIIHAAILTIMNYSCLLEGSFLFERA